MLRENGIIYYILKAFHKTLEVPLIGMDIAQINPAKGDQADGKTSKIPKK